MSLKKYPESGDILRSSLPTLPLSLSSGKFEHPFVKHPSMNPSWNGRVLIVAEPRCFWSSVSSASVGDSLYSKAARLLDGSEQLVVQLVVALIGRNVNPVEAGRQRVRWSLGSWVNAGATSLKARGLKLL